MAHRWMTETILVALEAGWPEGEGKPLRAPQNEIAYISVCQEMQEGQETAEWQYGGRLEITVSITLLSAFSIKLLPYNSTALPNSGASGDQVFKDLEPSGKSCCLLFSSVSAVARGYGAGASGLLQFPFFRS